MNVRIKFHYFYLFYGIVWTPGWVTATWFEAIPDSKFTFHVLSESYERTDVKCQMTCALTDGCKAVNSVWLSAEDAYSCQLLTVATKNSAHLDAAANTNYFCEYECTHLCRLVALRCLKDS